jgi:predicted HicB family RNase H-like nuclease
MNTHTFTFVIGYRHTLEKFNNLKRTLDWINGFAGVDVIIVEQDTHSKISHLPLKARQIFLKSSKPYNKAWGFNVATKLSKSNVIVFSDLGIIMDPNQFIEGLKAIEQYDMVSPYKKQIELQQNESGLQLPDILNIDRFGREKSICESLCIFRKDAIQKIGGWYEELIGNGEDEFLSNKVKQFLNWTEFEQKGYQLFYNREAPNMVLQQRNLQLLQTLNNLSKDDLVKSINLSIPKNSMVNKYDN